MLMRRPLIKKIQIKVRIATRFGTIVFELDSVDTDDDSVFTGVPALAH